MTNQVTMPIVRRWVEAFILKNEFRPSAALCASHFGIDRDAAQAFLDEIYGIWIARQEHQCRRKVYHAKRSKAEQGVLAMTRKHPGQKFQVYECPWCHGFHVGHAKDEG